MKLPAGIPDNFHLLMVEDAPPDFELIEHTLRKSGLRFSAKRVDTISELTRELKVQPPSIVLCDHGNAWLDSFTVLEFVRAHSATLPFIVVSGSLDENQMAKIVGQGADECVLKHHLAVLGRVVQSALRLGQARQQLALAAAERDRLRAELESWRSGRPRGSTVVSICAGCKKIHTPQGDWQQLETYFRDHFNIGFSHGLCPHCVTEYSDSRK